MALKKRFNDTGVCIPGRHYMVDISNKIAKILGMIEQGDYFTINRPRQYGKTTTMRTLNNLLKTSDEYFPIELSFEGIGEGSYKSETLFIKVLFLLMKEEFANSRNENLAQFLESAPAPDDFTELGSWFSRLVIKTGKKVVLMIDEVDKSSNNQLFLDFLGMLRNKYLKRDKEGESTFHSVILAGVHNVKNLKLKIRPDAEAKYNSPWNIAVNFKLEMSFNPVEIASMLKQYVEETGIEMDIDASAKTLFYYTSGYPFLVSKLCKIIDEEIIVEENRKKWDNDDIERAVNHLLKEQNTNFDSVVKNLENHKDLYEIVEKITLSDDKIEFNIYNSVVDMGVMYGIFKTGGPFVEINNRIYEELIYNYMATDFKIKELLKAKTGTYSLDGYYLTEDGSLDFERVLLKFQEFMKKEYSKRDEAFLERNGRLIFLAFLKPIINGKGYDFKEVQASEEKRMDVVVTYERKKFIIELKIWRGKKTHENGIIQLSRYLETQGLKNGYLVIFDFTKKAGKVYKQERIVSNQKEIFAIRV
jgi:hypothetical protein